MVGSTMAAAIVAEMVRFYAWPLDRMYTQQNKMASLRSLFVVCACVVAAIIQDQGAAQQVFLSTTKPTPCFGDTIELTCQYPKVMDQVNGQARYSVNTPSWRMNGEAFFAGGDVLKHINETASGLRVRIDPAAFTGDPVSFTCYLHLNSGGEDNASTVVDPQDEAEPPIFANPIVNGTRARVTWDHTDKGSCFSNLTFSYNITWNPVEKPQGKQSDVTEPGATEYNITNLERKTDYRVELEGFTDSDPSVYSKMAIVNFTIEGTVSQGGGTDYGLGVVVVAVAVVVVVVVVVAVVTVVAVALILCRKLQCWKPSWASTLPPSRLSTSPQSRPSTSTPSELSPSPPLGPSTSPPLGPSPAGVDASSEMTKEKLTVDPENKPVFQEKRKRMGNPVPILTQDYYDMGMEMTDAHHEPKQMALSEEGGTMNTSRT